MATVWFLSKRYRSNGTQLVQQNLIKLFCNGTPVVYMYNLTVYGVCPDYYRKLHTAAVYLSVYRIGIIFSMKLMHIALLRQFQ